MRITKSTADAVVASLYPVTSDLLKRFEVVKAAANVADGERDKLREYIQKHVPPGRYDDVLLDMEDTAEQTYVNADGKHALKNYCIVDGPMPEDGILCVVLATNYQTPEQLVDTILHELQKGKDNLLGFIKGNLLSVGITQENATFYSEKGGKKIKIVILPKPEAKNGPTGTD